MRIKKPITRCLLWIGVLLFLIGIHSIITETIKSNGNRWLGIREIVFGQLICVASGIIFGYGKYLQLEYLPNKKQIEITHKFSQENLIHNFRGGAALLSVFMLGSYLNTGSHSTDASRKNFETLIGDDLSLRCG